MTIAVAINVGDSLVLASDSATTQQWVTPAGHPDTINIWNSANKVFNLRKGLPVGAMTWGQASIDGVSIGTLMKDLRLRLTGQDAACKDWALDPDSYTIREVADRVRSFLYDDRPAPQPSGPLGLMIAGYSADSSQAEWFTISVDASGCAGPIEVLPGGEAGVATFGQPEAFTRLIRGVSTDLPQALVNLGVAPSEAGQYAEAIAAEVSRPIVFTGMPIGEVIDLADFLVETTIRFVRFTPGDATVGGPIEIAALTKHEGFKWVKRKHYFPASLNPTQESM
ncbi:hypothetical protein ACQPZQ_02405 [Pseudonocardia sp. CA-142604]|uniref:hypothetical protein n=1 Tax=Pseudonocardia sp. CA-142604 TaxID=3240024 RepID=UPI003D8E2127